MTVDRAALHPVLLERLDALLEDYAKVYPGEKLIVTSGLRSDKQQAAYYAQGRQPLQVVNALRAAAGMSPIADAENGHTVTNADGVRVRSNHQGKVYDGKVLGRAADVAPVYDHDALDCHNRRLPAGGVDWDDIKRFDRIGILAESCGLKWGGRWRDKQGAPKPDRPHVELPEDVP